MSGLDPAFYARRGSATADVLTVLHVPYTIWHLSYVAIGAALSPTFDWWRLLGTVVAFTAGLGVGAHAFDELTGRPLATSLSRKALLLAGVGAMGVAALVAIVGAFVISPLVLAWAAVGILLACAYSLEWSSSIHSDLGFALAWGAFPVLVGYWAQAETLTAAGAGAAVAATLLSLVQRRLSKQATAIRRGPTPSDADSAARRLSYLERPLRYLSAAMPLLAGLLLARHL